MHLQDYPGLSAWYHERQSAPPSGGDIPQHLTFRICEAISSPLPTVIDQFIRSLHQFLVTSVQPQKDFLTVISIFQACNADFLELMSELGELAVKTGRTTAFRQRVGETALKTGLAAMHFLAAWMALNTGDLAGCIEECEKVNEPFASIHTIHGQALLESGRAQEAIEVLGIATKLSPTELLAWFQLAKAYHVSGAYDAAWIALRQCQRLAPQSEEVALFLAMTALQTGDRKSEEKAAHAFKALSAFLPQLRNNGAVIGTLIQLACRLEEKALLYTIINEADWPSLQNTTDFVRRLPPVLRSLNELGWMDMAGRLLQNMTADKSA